MATKKTTTRTTKASTPKDPAGATILSMDPAKLESAVAGAMKLLAQMETLLAGLV